MTVQCDPLMFCKVTLSLVATAFGSQHLFHFHPCLPGTLYELELISLDLSFQQRIYKSCKLRYIAFLQLLSWRCLANCHLFDLKHRKILLFFFLEMWQWWCPHAYLILWYKNSHITLRRLRFNNFCIQKISKPSSPMLREVFLSSSFWLVWLATFFIPSVETVPQNKRELKLHLKTEGKRERLSFNGQTWQRESRTAVQLPSYFVFHIFYFLYNFTLHKIFSTGKI